MHPAAQDPMGRFGPQGMALATAHEVDPLSLVEAVASHGTTPSVTIGLSLCMVAVYLVAYLGAVQMLRAAASEEKDTTKGRNFQHGLLGASLALILEFYDFSLYGFFATSIGNSFLSVDMHHFQRKMVTFAIFWGAFAMRAFGGVIFGYLGDKFGRAVCLRWTLGMTMLATVGIGLIPPYAVIGSAATILLVAARLLQGVAVGGQLVGSLLLLLESCPLGWKCFTGSLVGVATTCGTWAGSVVGTLFMDTGFDEGWHWRLPFWAALVVGGVPLWLLWDAPEAESLVRAQRAADPEQKAALEGAIKEHMPGILRMIVVGAVYQAAFYMGYVFLPTYLSDDALPPHKKLPHAFTINTGGLTLICMLSFCWGYLADCWRFSYRWQMVVGCLAFSATVPVAFALLEQRTVLTALMGYALYSIPLSVYYSTLYLHVFEEVPDILCRYSAIGIGYNLSVMLFAGSAPNVGTVLTEHGGLAWCWPYLSGLGLIATAVLTWEARTMPAELSPGSEH